MKTKTKLIALIFILISSVSFSQEKTDFTLASVGKQVYGVYVFVGCTPHEEYIYVATIEEDINWRAHTKEERFEGIIAKAKKKYTDFNGLIVHEDNFDKVDLIRFKDMNVSRGGIELRSKITFIKHKQVYYGEVIELGSKKQGKEKEFGAVKYLDIYGDEVVEELKYTDMTPLSESEYATKLAGFKSETIARYTYSIDEKVSWNKGKEGLFGKITGLDPKSHKATVSYMDAYGDEINTKEDYLDLNKMETSKYDELLKVAKEEVQKHKFEVGNHVSWISINKLTRESTQMKGEIVLLDDKAHKASMKFVDAEGAEQIEKVDYLELVLEK